MAESEGNRLDILYVVSSLQTGGTEGQVASLATAMAKAGRRVAVYSLNDGSVRARLEEDGIEVLAGSAGHGPLRFIGIIFAALDIFTLMRRRRPGIAHFFLPAAYIVGAPLAVLARVPVRVMSRRSLNDYQKNAFVRSIERNLHRLMHAILGNSRRIVDELIGEGAQVDKLGLIYNGVDQGKFNIAGSRDEQKAHLDLPADAFVMSSVANLIPYKGHGDLIEALAIASPRLPASWRLLLVGRDNGIGRELKARVARHGLQDHILFLGSRSDIASILAASDLGILVPNGNEGFSNSILEAMVAGLPMIVTDIGGNAEAVVDGMTGLVVRAGDQQALADAIISMAGNADLRTKFGDAARKRVTENYGLSRFVESHQQLYQALLAGRRPSDIPAIRVDATASGN